ncbi:extracellular solute-binding protein [Paenibacillus mucilaginosus]|uniref:Family 1 extracellular solute-binding protein n=2 Tax=Paenibacillus mucilaginosus TaxID=61624 RepID=H6NP08_9BACL|nr:extracellular solute-binding protein [Paenibacillus mucilaginosus]AEI43436.1 extracellular solute-binding protein family 1 [Paenibacillus mucilaginosus KNP414]AFC31082.1 family 1 extracellular solute-binding protein [Paenibacillus mucilaginosus 3016]MCG7212018.1 extracellular solute-binding protein [Paenibacillus mucilaginosus]WDM24995.1 extracellular solute-binding protein [Paenibacillus mucilaginosus]WFA19666.1 extracellular solute-binding protein [Paenibacillus mucilaginosus]
MKRTKRTLSLLTVSSLAAGMLAACGGEKEGAVSGGSGGSGGEGERPKISIVQPNVGRKFPEGMNENNNPYQKYVNDSVNIDVHVVYPPSDGYQDKLNVMMSSGEDNDMIYTQDASWFISMVNQKALQPLNEALEKHGPDLKASIPQEAWDAVTVDGKIYAIPGVNHIRGSDIMYVRQDWLAKLGLQPPKTLDEYVNVMRRFAEDDPDGNGKQDTVGLLIGENLIRTAPFFGAFGVPFSANSAVTQWVERDGMLVNATILPETKEALGFLAGLYKNKWIDAEWALNKNKNIEEKVASGKAGLFSSTWFDTRGPILTSKKNDPKAQWIPLDYPVGRDGKSGVVSSSMVTGYSIVPAKSKRVNEVVKMMNFANGKGHETLKLGLAEHGISSRQDGKLVMNFEEHNKHIYRNNILDYASPWDQELDYQRLDALGPEFKLKDNVKQISSALIKNAYNGPATASMGKNGVQLTKLMQETFTKIIMGSLPLDDFDNYAAQWKSQGGDEITKEVNANAKKAGK